MTNARRSPWGGRERELGRDLQVENGGKARLFGGPEDGRERGKSWEIKRPRAL